MKKLLFLGPFLLLLLGVLSCEKADIDKLLTFYIDDSQTIRIPANSPVGVLTTLPGVSVTTRSSETFRNNNTSAELVKDVSLNKLTLTITSPSTQTFDFLESIELYISTDQSDQILLASLSSIPRGVRSIELNSANAKLDKYIKASAFTLTTKVKASGLLTQEVTIKADSRFKVTADPL
ncbi:hypothetical protein LJY25_20715 [Hymenobacter sp. BT175]|uniref:hypothetical protein n=1 Tax=Hymenobacter translucens TaxID=2886507 RepID=UPI001D0E4CA8|nr:hypothetical protein [Hymenobacter translucens]MCC2548884.1 hypothetical protein [Hymenobacter translucens]